MQLSLVIPLLNEADSLPELQRQIEEALQSAGLEYEGLYMDDGSRDNSWEIIESLAAENPRVKGIKFQRNFGKAAGLRAGFAHARGDVVVTLDADLQDDPAEIPGLYRMIIEDGYDMVSGWKKKRLDPVGKKLPSRFFNFVVRVMSGIRLHDFNCGLKAYRKNVVKSIELYGEMHRYIPVIAKWAGFDRIGEKVVHHRKRQYGKSKYGIERFMRGFLDMLSVMFITRFGKRPMHLFGLLGTLMFFAGFVILVYLTVTKIWFNAYGMTQRPLFYLGLLTVTLGAQLFLTGFIAELITRSSADKNPYLIEKTIGDA